MGYEVTRFEGGVDEELICPICSGVLEEPLQAPHMDHCTACVITQWLLRQQTCPVDRSVVTPAHLKPVPRIMRNMLSKLTIRCENAPSGCTAMLRLDLLASHAVRSSRAAGKQSAAAGQGCGLIVPKDEMNGHVCVRDLRALVLTQQHKLSDLEKMAAEHRHQLAEQKREIQLLKEYMRALRNSTAVPRSIEQPSEQNEVLGWVNALQPARVTRWGGMISTPDAVLQAVIKRSLLESGCPLAVVTGLIENSHERKWPPGLSTLETRQMNRRYYENYVTKRVPGKQAVVAMALENQHMGDDMIVEPGLVMIFAHGVEDV
uniref:RING-type E3 ubiquitin transferase n=1 Tax=Petromyzon marinus TaxID=7757 RepID=S4R997_PETMA